MCLISNIPHYKKCVFHYTVPSKVLEHTLMPKSLSNLGSDGWMIEIAVMNMVCLLTSVIYGRVATLTLNSLWEKTIYDSPLTFILTYAIHTLTLTSFCPVTHYYSLHFHPPPGPQRSRGLTLEFVPHHQALWCDLDRLHPPHGPRRPRDIHLNLYPITKPCGTA